MKKIYENPEIVINSVPAMHTVELATSWPWGDDDETEIIGG